MRYSMVVLVLGLAACGDRADKILGLTGDPVNGEAVYTDNCATCHQASGLGEDDPVDPGTGENLTEAAGEVGEDAEFVEYILNGNGDMTAFSEILDDQEIADVLAYMHDGLIQ